MARFLLLSAALLLAASPSFASDQTADTLAHAAAEEIEEVPAKAKHPRPPAYPAACEPAIGDVAENVRVTVAYTVTRNGQPENVRVRESSNPCFNDTAVAAVRNWDFEPRRVNRRRVAQEDLETTFVFVFQQETQALNFDARPLKRLPPQYPQRCFARASDSETVVVSFDVTKEGETENIKIVESTYSCLNTAAKRSVKQWIYEPRIIDGEPVRRNGVQTAITFKLSSGNEASWRVRGSLRRELGRVRRDALRRGEPQKALERLVSIEERYGASFSQLETAEFYYARAIVRIELGEYRGALDDLRVVKDTGVASAEVDQAVSETIIQLEAAIYAQQAGAVPEADAPSEQP